VGHLTRKKTVPDVTGTVFDGMLNLAQPVNHAQGHEDRHVS